MELLYEIVSYTEPFHDAIAVIAFALMPIVWWLGWRSGPDVG